MLFTSLIWGLILFCISYIVVSVIVHITSFDAPQFDSVLQFKIRTSTFIMFVFVGIVLLIDRSRSNELINEIILDSIDSNMDFLIFDAMIQNQPLQVTLQSRKVYIGCVTKFTFPETRKADILMLPLYSGYRDEKTQELTITTNYRYLIKKLDLFLLTENDYWSIAIRTSDIATVRNFNEKIHELFESQNKKQTSC